MSPIYRSVVAVIALVLVAGCIDEYTFEPPESLSVDHVFTYVPRADGPAITSIVVRGSFNDWSGNDLAMVEQADGSWEVTRTLDPGTYEYKYVFNGEQWAGNMCADGTWGNPAGGAVDPNVQDCNGENALLVIGS